jgi:hypothetical protein
MISKTETQLNAIQEYMDAVADYHEATLLVAEMRSRLLESIKANKKAGLSSADPLSAIVGLSAVESKPVVETVVRKTTLSRKSNNTKRSRNSPGYTKKLVYEALPGDVSAIGSRTGLTHRKIWAAAADLLKVNMIEKHGTRGNTTYTVKGSRVEWSERQFAAKYTPKSSSN